MQHLRANTQVIVTVGPFVDVGDGFTPQTDITLGGDEAELIKHGTTSVVDISGATWVAVTGCRGYYSLTLTTAYVDTEGMLVVIVQDDSDTLPVKQEYMVLSEAAWDSLYVAKDDGFMDVNIRTVGRADAQETEADNLESACSNYSATRGLTGTALPAVAADGAGGVPISDAGELDMDALNTAAVRLTAARAQAIDDWINGGRLDLILDAILADTVVIGTAGAGLSNIPWNSSWDAEVQSEVVDALVALNLVLTNTTIATLASQTEFTLAAGSADDDAYKNCVLVVEDASTAVQKAVGIVGDYTGASKTITLKQDPGIFVMATSDKVYILPVNSLEYAAILQTLPGQEAPPLTPTPQQMDAWNYKLARNRTTETATEFRLYADNQTTVDAKATVSDDGTTAIKQEVVSGP